MEYVQNYMLIKQTHLKLWLEQNKVSTIVIKFDSGVDPVKGSSSRLYGLIQVNPEN